MSTQSARYRLFAGFRCNNACRFCDQADARLASSDTPVLIDLVEEALQRNAKALTFCGGECTRDIELLCKAASRARALGCEEVRVFTNGRMLSYRPITRQLVSNGVTHFDISLHGSIAATHDWVTRVPSSFQQTIRGARCAARLGSQVTLNTVLVRSNYRQLSELTRLAITLGAGEIHFRFPMPEGAVCSMKAMPSLVPRFRLVLPHLQGAARLCEGCGLGMWIHDIPDCQAGSLRNRIQRHRAEWLGLPKALWSRAEKRYGQVCSDCRARDICLGAPTEYLAYHGEGELKAL